MNDSQGRAIPSRPIPKRPSQQPGQSPSLPKRSFLLSESSQSISAPPPLETEQDPVIATPSSVQSDDANSRSSLAEMVTVKSMALCSKASVKGKSRSIPYPAIVNYDASRLKVSSARKSSPTPYPAMIRDRRARKWGLLAWITSFAFLK